jgi:hypothetical protein
VNESWSETNVDDPFLLIEWTWKETGWRVSLSLPRLLHMRGYYIKYQIAFRRGAQRRPSKHTHTHTRVTDVTRMARFGRSGGRRERETLGPTPLDEMGDAHTHTHTHTEINKLRCSVMTRGKRLADIKPATKFLLTSLLLNHITCVMYPFAACESTCVYIAQCV